MLDAQAERATGKDDSGESSDQPSGHHNQPRGTDSMSDGVLREDLGSRPVTVSRQEGS